MKKEYFSTVTGDCLKENSEELNKIKNTNFYTAGPGGTPAKKTNADNIIGYRVKANDNNGGVEILGVRKNQEDRMIIAEELPEFHLLSDYEPPNAQPAQESARKQVIRETVEQAQASLQNIQEGGSTAIVSITQGNYIYTAGVGDSVTYKVVRRKSTGEVIFCQRLNRILHKPTEPTEVERIEKDYGKGNIKKDVYGIERLGRTLSMTRAFGDNDFKKFGLISDPGEIYCDKIVDDPQKLDPDLEIFQITACDGLTEPAENIDNPNFSDKTLVNNLKKKLEEEPYKKFKYKDEKYIAKLFTENKELQKNNPDLSIVATEFAEQAMEDGSTDNISINIRRLDPTKEVAELAVIFDGHANAVVSEALADEKTGFVAILKNNIKKALEQKKQEYIQKLKRFLVSSDKDFKVLSDDKGQYTSYTRVQALFDQRNDKKFVAAVAGCQPLRQKIYNDAKAEPEAAKRVFAAKNYTVLPAGFRKSVAILSAKQIAELLQVHADVEGFVDTVCGSSEHTNVDLVKLAKADVNAFEIIINTPKLFAKLGDKQQNEIVRFYFAHPQEDALSIMINKPELYSVAGRKNLLKMAAPFIQEDNNPKFCYSRAEIEQVLKDEKRNLNLALAQFYATGSPRAQFYLSVLYDAYAKEKKGLQGKGHKEQMAEISLQWLEKAANAKKGPIEAKCDLAERYLEKINLPDLPLPEKKDLIQKVKKLTNDARKGLRSDDKQYGLLTEKVGAISTVLSQQEAKLVPNGSVSEPNSGSSIRYLFTHHHR